MIVLLGNNRDITFLCVTKPNLSYASLATHAFKTENVILTQAGDCPNCLDWLFLQDEKNYFSQSVNVA